MTPTETALPMTNTTERCETCRFAKAYPMPEGECPPLPEPEKPKGFWRMLWEAPGLPYCNAEFFQALKHVAWKRAEDKAKTTVECQRFPEAPDKLKTDWCGEYHA